MSKNIDSRADYVTEKLHESILWNHAVVIEGLLHMQI